MVKAKDRSVRIRWVRVLSWVNVTLILSPYRTNAPKENSALMRGLFLLNDLNFVRITDILFKLGSIRIKIQAKDFKDAQCFFLKCLSLVEFWVRHVPFDG